MTTCDVEGALANHVQQLCNK